MSNKDIFSLDDDEYYAIDDYLKEKNKGLIRLKSGEWINPSYVVMIKKIIRTPIFWAGDIPLYDDEDIMDKIHKKIIKFDPINRSYVKII